MAESSVVSNSSNAEKHNEEDMMNEIENQFLSGVPSKCFLTEDILNYIVDNIDEVIRRTVHHELNKRYPVKCSSQISFLKTILRAAEVRCVEISSDVYDVYLDLLQATSRPSDFHYVHHSVDRNHISIKEKSSVISNGTTGLSVWQAGTVLARYCRDNRAQFANKAIIELGSGLGFTGISTILSCQPRRYCFTDAYESVLEYLLENVRTNLGDRLRTDERSTHSDEIVLNATYENCDVSILKLPWEDELTAYVADHEPDFILGADVTYDPSSFHSFCTCLIKLMKLKETCQTILSCTVRNEDTLKQFFECLHEYKLYETLVTENEVWNSCYNQKCRVQIFSVLLDNR